MNTSTSAATAMVFEPAQLFTLEPATELNQYIPRGIKRARALVDDDDNERFACRLSYEAYLAAAEGTGGTRPVSSFKKRRVQVAEDIQNSLNALADTLTAICNKLPTKDVSPNNISSATHTRLTIRIPARAKSASPSPTMRAHASHYDGLAPRWPGSRPTPIRTPSIASKAKATAKKLVVRLRVSTDFRMARALGKLMVA